MNTMDNGIKQDDLKLSIDNFGNNFSFNISAILIFSLFLNFNKETLILAIGVIINLMVSYGASYVLGFKYLQQFFCKDGCQNTDHALESIQMFGFLTGYYTFNRLMKYTNMKWVLCFACMVCVSILFSNKYAHDNYSFASILIMWLLGLLIGAFTGYLSGNSALEEISENLPKNATATSDATCSQSNQNDYVCQAFKDGKVYNAN